MTHVWLHSLDPAFDSLLPSMGDHIAAELGHSNYLIEKWVPFVSERRHRDASQAILLLVGDWHCFSKKDYFIASNALALHESGVALLLPVVTEEPAAVPDVDDVWLERYKGLWERLYKISILKPLRNELKLSPEEIALKVRDSLLAILPEKPKPQTKPATLFFSYCHRDQDLRDQLAHHLKLLERVGLIEGWHDRKIAAGEEWSAAIDAHLYTSDLILLLLSSDFFASDYCSEIEAPIALERHKVNAARTIPIVLRPVMWRQSPLAALQALPTDARPVTSWSSTDSAFVDVCEGIVSSLLAGKSQTSEEKDFAAAKQFLNRRRVFDCAMPAAVEVDKSFMLVVLVRKPLSAGLRALFASDVTYGVEPEDVRSSPMFLQFPIGERKKPESINLRITLSSPDFNPPEQTRTLTLDPYRDSQPLIFMLAAQRTGTLRAALEIYNDHNLITSHPLGTIAQTADTSKQEAQIVSGEFWTFDDLEALNEELQPARLVEMLPRVKELIEQSQPVLARRMLLDLQRIDPQNTEVRHLMRVVQENIARGAKSDQLGQVIQQADEAVRNQNYDEALRVYRLALRIDPTNSGLASKINQLSELKERADKINVLKTQASEARDRNDFGSPQDLIAEEERRQVIFDQIVAEIQDQVFRGHLEKALELIQRALDRLPREGVLVRLKVETKKKHHAAAMQKLVEETSMRVQTLFFTAPQEALAAVQQALEKAPDEERLLALQQRVVDQLKRSNLQGLRSQYLKQAQGEMEGRDFTAAIWTLEKALSEYGESAEAQSLLDYAREEKQSYERRKSEAAAGSFTQIFGSLARELPASAESAVPATSSTPSSGGSSGGAGLTQLLRTLDGPMSAPFPAMPGEASTHPHQDVPPLSAAGATTAFRMPDALPDAPAAGKTPNGAGEFTCITQASSLRDSTEKDEREQATVEAIQRAAGQLRQGQLREGLETLEAVRQAHSELPTVANAIAEYKVRRAAIANASVSRAMSEARQALIVREAPRALEILRKASPGVEFVESAMQADWKRLVDEVTKGAGAKRGAVERTLVVRSNEISSKLTLLIVSVALTVVIALALVLWIKL